MTDEGLSILPPQFAQRVMAWQRTSGRHGLPWQGTRDPYRVWLSEVMLQQTQVQTVLSYYDRFLQRFPTVQALAEAPQDDVLALWSGLGYYSRARNLHRCAQSVVRDWGGAFPSRSVDLATLPGIGPSTAAAIASFCFDESAAILDGNVKRVLSRVLGFDQDLGQARAVQALWALARALMPSQNPGTYTQGLMDLGSQLCTPRRPDCGRCPVADDCRAFAQGQPEAFPVKLKRLRRRQRHSVFWIVVWRAQVLLVQRPAQGVWASLWTLPEQTVTEGSDASLGDPLSVPQDVSLQPALPGQGQPMAPFKHVLTHLDWFIHPLVWRWPEAHPEAPTAPQLVGLDLGERHRWLNRHDALALGLPVPVRRLIEEVLAP